MPCSSRPLQFLSTPSARRATSFCIRPSTLGIHFYPRPPRGGRPITCARVHVNIRYFYPRPPRGGRHGKNPDINYILQFLSTPSARRATHRFFDLSRGFLFLSTPSARRATGLGDKWFEDNQISIHALREEGDHRRGREETKQKYFYPRPPRGGRRASCGTAFPTTNFYPRPPRGGRRRPSCRPSRRRRHFYPRPPRGGRPLLLNLQHCLTRISIHALREEGD